MKLSIALFSVSIFLSGASSAHTGEGAVLGWLSGGLKHKQTACDKDPSSKACAKQIEKSNKKYIASQNKKWGVGNKALKQKNIEINRIYSNDQNNEHTIIDLKNEHKTFYITRAQYDVLPSGEKSAKIFCQSVGAELAKPEDMKSLRVVFEELRAEEEKRKADLNDMILFEKMISFNWKQVGDVKSISQDSECTVVDIDTSSYVVQANLKGWDGNGNIFELKRDDQKDIKLLSFEDYNLKMLKDHHQYSNQMNATCVKNN